VATSASERKGAEVSNHSLSEGAKHENALTLAGLLDIDAHEAAQRLDISILISHDASSETAMKLADETRRLLERTISHPCAATDLAVAEVIIGGGESKSTKPKLWVTLRRRQLVIASAPHATSDSPDWHGSELVIAACYVAAAALKAALGASLPFAMQDVTTINFDELGITADLTKGNVDLGRMYLAGAGAIGNGMLWALRHFNVSGRIDVVDDDRVEDRNLQRQVWFNECDIGEPKAERLVGHAQPSLPRLLLVPRESRLEKLPESGKGKWLENLISAVDSPRVRRTLQLEFPGAVFDASTTGIEEIVLHFNRQPTHAACLGCIYFPGTAEHAREEEIARHLGVTVSDVQRLTVDRESARKIRDHLKNDRLNADDLVGQSFDSLFKALCAEQHLLTPAAQHVLAPFAFVSVLAGALLAVEIVKRHSRNAHGSEFNYWRVSPWQAPIPQLQKCLLRRDDCPCCGKPEFRAVAQSLWG
jgi:hypothetical protein